MKIMIKGIEQDFTRKSMSELMVKVVTLYDRDEYNRDVKSLFAEIIKRVHAIEIDKIKDDRGM